MSGLGFPLVPMEGGTNGPTFGEESFHSRLLWPDAPLVGWVTNHHMQAVIGAAVVILLWLWLSSGLKVVPGKKQFAGEFLYNIVRNGIARDILGHGYKPYVPYLLALFSFILVNNLMGEFFLFMFPTFSKIGFAYGLAILSFLLYNGAGIAKHGLVGYLRNSLVPRGVPWWLLPLIIPLEFISNFVTRPITLALRLFGNLFAGHLVVLVFVVGGGWLLTQLHNPVYVGAGAISMLVSLAIFALELLVAFLQAYIFTVLTAQYVSSATAEEH